MSDLATYQASIGNTDEAALHSLAKATTHPFVITGQQVGLMGGPAYTILKAISCIEEARRLGCVPLFWAATEDHDVAEVASTYGMSEKGDLVRYKVPLPAHFVEEIPMTGEIEGEVLRFCNDYDVEPPPSSERYAQAMISLLVRLFKGTGLLFIEPYVLRKQAADFFVFELEHARDLKTPLTYREGDTNLFYKTAEGKRRRIRVDEAQGMMGEARVCPERFSTGAAARCRLQSTLFDTRAYVAGPSESLYWKELNDYFQVTGTPYPEILPRMRCQFEVRRKSPHYLRNFMQPRGKPQERVFNWHFLQSLTRADLLDQCRRHAVVEEQALLGQAEPLIVPLEETIIDKVGNLGEEGLINSLQ